MPSLEDAQVAVQLVSRSVVAHRPTRKDANGPRTDATNVAVRAAQEVDEFLDQIGII
jgi:hypothetical protein